MAYPKIDIGQVANVFIRMMTFEKVGDVEDGHTHDFDHVTLLSKGSLKVISDGKESVFIAPHMIFIKKDKHHHLIALEDGTIASCIHGIRNSEGDIIDAACIP